MSRVRRLILILAALFVLTIGGGVAYLSSIKTATAEDALRFAIVETEGPREIIPGLSGPCSVESIAIENTSAVPFHVISVWITETEMPGVAGVNIALAPTPGSSAARTSGVATPEAIVVPPRGTIYATSGVPLGGIAIASKESLRINVLSQPRLNYLAGRALEWLHEHSPQFLRAHIPASRVTLQHRSLDASDTAR